MIPQNGVTNEGYSMKSPKAVFVNPSRITTGTAFVMPAAQATLAGAVPGSLDIRLKVVDEAVERFNPHRINAGDIVCISALTNNVREAYRVMRQAKARGATAVLGGPHPTLVPEEAIRSGADAVVRGDGDTIIGRVLEDCITRRIPASKIYQDSSGHPFRVSGEQMAYPRLDLMKTDRYVAASLRSAQGCREHCSFCTVPVISGHAVRDRPVEMVAREVRELHRRNIRFVIWGADNLVQYPRSLVESARPADRAAFEAERERSLTFFRRFGELTGDERVWGFAQLTLRLHDDPEMLHALSHDGAICAALFGIESVDSAALKRMAKQWNGTRDEIVEKVRRIQRAGIHVLGSMIVGLPTDTPETIQAMREFAVESGMSVAQFPIYEILPGSPDYAQAKRDLALRQASAQSLPIYSRDTQVPRVRLLRDEYWLEDDTSPHLEHPHLSIAAIKEQGRKSWRYFYRLRFLFGNGIRYRWPLGRTTVYALVCKAFATFYGGAVGLAADSVRVGNASFLMRKLMAAAAWGMRRIPPPPSVSCAARNDGQQVVATDSLAS
jgi:radical SAM superfamily enzyme YgiQ (UPF0313 family)